MNYYDVDPDGTLVRVATLATDDPEPDARAVAAAQASDGRG
jgi:hypothetical protein